MASRLDERRVLRCRPRRGTVLRQPTRRGTSYDVAFSYRGEQVYVHLGGESEGWDDERAAQEQQFLMEKVNRGEWSPPRPGPDAAVLTATPTFQGEASQWLYPAESSGPETLTAGQRPFAISSRVCRS
jgi:hypothetical protein